MAISVIDLNDHPLNCAKAAKLEWTSPEYGSVYSTAEGFVAIPGAPHVCKAYDASFRSMEEAKQCVIRRGAIGLEGV